MVKNTLVFGIILLFIVSAVSPMVIGFNAVKSERDELLDNLTFYCLDASGSNAKYEYYKEKLLKEYSNDGMEIVDKVTISIESPQTIVSSGPMDSSWPMKCHDTHHTSRSPYNTANVTGQEKWRFRANEGVDGGPIIGNDGTIYFGDKEGHVYAIHSNGSLKWEYHTGYNFITSTPALAEDGTLYVGSWDHYLYAINSSSGVRKWKFNARGTIASSPTIAGDGTIYFGTMWDSQTGHRIYAANPNGTEKWQYKTGNDITSDPVIGDDGTVYVGSCDTYFYAMHPNGTLKWRFKTGDYIKGPASIADDGTVYIGSFDGYLYALYPNNGTMKWKYGAGTETNPSIASDGTIYVGSLNKLHAIYPNGTRKWTFTVGSSSAHITQSSPAISADGIIYVGTQIGSVKGGDIIAVNPDGTEQWRKLICNEWIRSSPCIAEDGTVYIGSQDNGGYLHAFGPVDSNSPPETPTISGATNGKVREDYWYTFRAVDPDNNPISWYIEWGDGTNTGWTLERASNENCYYEHKWLIRGAYTIRAKAKITKRIYPHLFRASLITHMDENGASMMEIKAQSRHKDVKTLEIYIRHSEEHIKNVYMNTVPTLDGPQEPKKPKPIPKRIEPIPQQQNREDKYIDLLREGFITRDDFLKLVGLDDQQIEGYA
ncbi:MAG: PQQ-binding-like beta-propeller repeat protein [Thermoplasmatales archaeon]|nr:PQQ-binding-like beta-propeller repeat protein [Thermoplasmatales archaeon]